MNNTLLTKCEVLNLIKNDDPNITFVKPKSSPLQSQVWTNFSYVYCNNNKQNFVCCDGCKEILVHIPSNGTSSMTKHQKMCSKTTSCNNDQRNIKEYFTQTKVQSIPKKLKEKVTIAATEFAVLDTRPFHLFCGGGFTDFAQTIFNAGKALFNTSNINVEDLLPHPTTVSKNIDE